MVLAGYAAPRVGSERPGSGGPRPPRPESDWRAATIDATVATADNDPPERPSGTPVPPRGKKKGAGRPGTGRGATPAGRNRPGGPRPSAAQRTANNRRAALQAQRKRRNTLLAVGAVGVVIVVVAVLVAVSALGGGKHTSAIKTGQGTASGSGGSALPASAYHTLHSPSVATLAAAAKHYHHSQLTFPHGISDKALTTGGKPEVLYIGAEYCPYCATERWPLTIALSKFGTFSGLREIKSNTSDPGIQHLSTLSYYGSHYSSPYLSFVPVETENTQGKTLVKPTKAQLALLNKYTKGQIPFVDLGGKAAILGAELDAHLLSGLSHAQILHQIKQGSSVLAANIDADAGAIVSNLCQLTHGKPGNVCSAFSKPLRS